MACNKYPTLCVLWNKAFVALIGWRCYSRNKRHNESSCQNSHKLFPLFNKGIFSEFYLELCLSHAFVLGPDVFTAVCFCWWHVDETYSTAWRSRLGGFRLPDTVSRLHICREGLLILSSIERWLVVQILYDEWIECLIGRNSRHLLVRLLIWINLFQKMSIIKIIHQHHGHVFSVCAWL